MISRNNLYELTYSEHSLLRVDKFLSSSLDLNLYSRAYIEKMIANGSIKVNGSIIKKSYLLNKDDLISIELPPEVDSKPLPEDILLDIVYEDEYLGIINKQPGISVHPAPGNYSGTIVNALLHKYGEDNLADNDDPLRPGIVHRLDKDTSGLLIIAKDDRTLSLMSKQFADRTIKKYYQAIICGIPRDPSGKIETKIERSKNDRTKMTVSSQGRRAVTKYRVLKTFEYFALVDIMLETGRTHQLRVHFDYINCPILGDNHYGKKKSLSLVPINLKKKINSYLDNHLKRQALHSYKLEFSHPITAQDICIEIPLPNDMLKCIDWIKNQFEEETIDSSFE